MDDNTDTQSDDSSPTIEEDTVSPQLPNDDSTQSTQHGNDNGNDTNQERKQALETSFIKETLTGSIKAAQDSFSELPFNVLVTAVVVTLTGGILLLSIALNRTLTGFGLIFTCTGLYLIYVFSQTDNGPTVESRKQYIIYYGTASLFTFIGLAYLFIPV